MRSSPAFAEPDQFNKIGVAAAETPNAQASSAALRREGEIFECMACHERAITKHALMPMIGMEYGETYTLYMYDLSALECTIGHVLL
ncbi:MAG TPA: hypothetical protein VKM55_17585 [Candidatus Lokiarchaeia archaeon]|nr:hypothetical protein [Candidatus Lokiarchaeia archaeon]